MRLRGEQSEDRVAAARAAAFRLFLFGYDFVYVPTIALALVSILNAKQKTSTGPVVLLVILIGVVLLVNLGAAGRRWWAPLVALPQVALAIWLYLRVSGQALARTSIEPLIVPAILLGAHVVVLLFAVHVMRIVSKTSAPDPIPVSRGTVVPLHHALVAVLARVVGAGGSITESVLQQAATIVREMAGPGAYEQSLTQDLNLAAVQFDQKAYSRACNSLRHDLGSRRRKQLLKLIAELAESSTPPEVAFDVIESLRAELEPERPST